MSRPHMRNQLSLENRHTHTHTVYIMSAYVPCGSTVFKNITYYKKATPEAIEAMSERLKAKKAKGDKKRGGGATVTASTASTGSRGSGKKTDPEARSDRGASCGGRGYLRQG